MQVSKLVSTASYDTISQDTESGKEHDDEKGEDARESGM